MSERLLGFEVCVLKELWPACENLSAAYDRQGRPQPYEAALADLRNERDRLEGELDDVEAEIRGVLRALGRDNTPPRHKVTWAQVDDQLATVVSLHAQYGVPLPPLIERACDARQQAAEHATAAFATARSPLEVQP